MKQLAQAVRAGRRRRRGRQRRWPQQPRIARSLCGQRRGAGRGAQGGATRIFSSESGRYGTGLDDAALATDTWKGKAEGDRKLAELYLSRMQYAYGPDEADWGRAGVSTGVGDAASTSTPSTCAAPRARCSRAASNLYGMLTTDDPFQYLGGIGPGGAPPGRQGAGALHQQPARRRRRARGGRRAVPGQGAGHAQLPPRLHPGPDGRRATPARCRCWTALNNFCRLAERGARDRARRPVAGVRRRLCARQAQRLGLKPGSSSTTRTRWRRASSACSKPPARATGRPTRRPVAELQGSLPRPGAAPRGAQRQRGVRAIRGGRLRVGGTGTARGHRGPARAEPPAQPAPRLFRPRRPHRRSRACAGAGAADGCNRRPIDAAAWRWCCCRCWRWRMRGPGATRPGRARALNLLVPCFRNPDP
jgi:hypothetical protein